MQSWQKSLVRVLAEHNHTSIRRLPNGGRALVRKVGDRTREERQRILFQCFRELRELGYRLEDVRNLRTKHIEALMKYWEAKGRSAATLQCNLSTLRALSIWIGKPSLIGPGENYVNNPACLKRSYATTRDKTWSGNEVDFREIIKKIEKEDKHVAMQLRLEKAFGLRVKEALLFRPYLADQKTFIAVNYGTKNGRPRIVPVSTAEQRQLLERAKRMVGKVGSMIPDGYRLKDWLQHYYYILRKCGITRAEQGVTSHGLRHEYLNRRYKQIAKAPSPVKGQARGQITKEMDNRARAIVSEEAGHSRPQIVTAYTSTVSTMEKVKGVQAEIAAEA